MCHFLIFMNTPMCRKIQLAAIDQNGKKLKTQLHASRTCRKSYSFRILHRLASVHVFFHVILVLATLRRLKAYWKLENLQNKLGAALKMQLFKL